MNANLFPEIKSGAYLGTNVYACRWDNRTQVFKELGEHNLKVLDIIPQSPASGLTDFFIIVERNELLAKLEQ
jgi:hypothetical protein